MKFESKFGLDDVLATNFGGDLVKVKAVIFSDENSGRGRESRYRSA